MKLLKFLADSRHQRVHRRRRQHCERLFFQNRQLPACGKTRNGLASFGFEPTSPCDQPRERKSASFGRSKHRENGILVAALDRREKWQHARIFAAMQRRERIEHSPASNCGHRRKATNDKAIARQRENWFAQTQLRKSNLARRKCFAFEKHHFGDSFGSAVMKMNARAILQRRRRRQQLQPRIKPLRGKKFAGRSERQAAMPFFEFNSSEIDGGPLSSDSLRDS